MRARWDRWVCRRFGCNAARVLWRSSGRVRISCSRCGATAEWVRS